MTFKQDGPKPAANIKTYNDVKDGQYNETNNVTNNNHNSNNTTNTTITDSYNSPTVNQPTGCTFFPRACLDCIDRFSHKDFGFGTKK
jgi:hypothetical protein